MGLKLARVKEWLAKTSVQKGTVKNLWIPGFVRVGSQFSLGVKNVCFW